MSVASAIPVQTDKQLSRPELDVSKLHGLPSEQQNLFLFTFTANLVRYISSLSNERANEEEKVLLQELMKLVRLSTPVSNRVIRSNIGCCFSTLFARGNRSAIFDTISELIGIIQAGGKEVDLNTKFCAVVAVGEIFAGVGYSIASRSNSTILVLLKLLKAAQHHAGLKASIYVALKKVISGAHSFVDDPVAKDVWKSARNATGDKAYIVQASAISCLEELVNQTTPFDNASDFDNLKSTLWKAIGSPSQNVRHGAASCLAASLVKAYHSIDETADYQSVSKTSKQTNKRQSVLQGEARTPERTSSPSRKSEPRLAFTLPEMLKQLSVQYCKISTSHRTRVGIAICYRTILRSLGEEVVETHYPQIASHFLNTILTHPTVTNNRFRLLTTRKIIKSLLEDTIGRELLHESGRLSAAKWLVNNVIKDYPQVVTERPEPSKQTLASALSALSAFTDLLQSAFTPVAESTREALLQVLQHPSYTVQIHASHCLRSFILACPQQLMVCLTICMNCLTRELSQLSTPRQSTRRCLGFVYALSSTLSASRLQPLYGSVSIYAEIFEKATNLLKISTDSELRVAATQIQVAWTLIGGLMSLGPNFTKIHLSRLFLLWKNALSKPFPKDLQRGPLEVGFLVHVRECALASIFAFLEFNSRLVTHDGSRRIAAVLQNTILFLEYLPTSKASNDISERLMPSLQLRDLIIMVRRRVLQCFIKLVNLDQSNHSLILSMSNVLGHAVNCFADPDVTPSTTFDSSITNISTHFENLWELEDNFGFGVTGFVHEFNNETASVRKRRDLPGDWSDINHMEREIDGILTTPICHAREHDPLLLYATRDNRQRLLPVPPRTGVVDAAIELFSVSLPFLPPKVQESIVEQLAALLSTQSLNRNPGRKAAMVVNITVALSSSLKIAAESTIASGNLNNPPTEKIIQELLLGFITNPDPVVRCLASEALGRLSNGSVDAFTNQQLSSLIDMIIDNRDPNVRAGCALTLAHVLSQVSVMAGSHHLKTIVGCLVSLCNDQHPVVHFWALDGLVKVTEAAGLTFSPYASGTLGTLARLYLSDTHNVLASSFVSSNFEDTFSTTVVISRCVDSLINVLGPDLRETSKTCELVMALLRQFGFEKSTPVNMESSKCLDHLALYAANRLDFKAYVRWLEQWLASDNLSMRAAAVHGINNLMKSDAELVIRNASHTFGDELWLALHDFVDNNELRNMFLNWLQQTGLTDTKEWIKRFQNVLSRGRSKINDLPTRTTQQPANPLNLDVLDEEAAGFASTIPEEHADDAMGASTPKHELLNWQTRAFAMACLGDLLTMIQNEIQPDQTVPSELALRESIGEIVRMAFSASTSGVLELRILGLKTFDKLLLMFGRTPDPDFAEASILEQYQAQIASAIAPAFTAESSPELVTQAINVCATFVSAGVVTNVDRMGRIFRPLLVGLKDLSKNSDTTQIGDFRGLNTNARVIVRVALYSAWARLQIMSAEHSYLLEIVTPHTALLTPLWLTSLQEYARLRFEPEISSAIPTVHRSEDVAETYASLNREILLEVYQNCWLNFVDAIASLVEKDSTFVFDALDGKFSGQQDAQEPAEDAPQRELSATGALPSPKINYRNEPVAFFFLLFGLSFEALMNENIPSTQRIAILQALQKTLRPSIAGNSIYQPAVFSETMDTLDRLVMTEASNTQTVIVGIARNLSLNHPSASMAKEVLDQMYDEIEQLFELTRNIILVLVDHLPSANTTPTGLHARYSASEDSAALIWFSLSALVDVANVFPSIIRNDLCACIIHIFMTILATGTCQADVAPQSLPIFRRFIQEFVPSSPTGAGDDSVQDRETISLQIRGCILRLLSILEFAQRREFDSSLPCAKNTLLALTIVFTLSGNVIPPQDPLIPQALDSFLDCLQDVGLSGVASGCIRTLLMGSHPRSPIDDSIARFLFPRLIAFVTNVPINGAEPLLDPENCKPLITQTLVSCAVAMRSDAMPAAMSMLVPAILQRARLEGPDSYEELSARLVELVAANRLVFRELMSKLNPPQGSLLEEILRSNVEKKKRQEAENKKKNEPSIALRMDF